ncbi:Major facilitator superfamily multidrug-resistance DHA1 sub-family [Mycena venus]|uniref:Major facilitator superfamily multidrug-resistance DHA1 sub-family n=1 Tax=Mycena venus TaxID=2733690 RepID=A0A8H6YYE6_9AGAR|nr:Major facilitator superfamily multidrug-resistance DHA1 sub-family [Mycena venus]
MPSDINEETALLRPPQRKRTPLPKLQLSIIMLIQICAPIASQSIYPYINQLVSELDITGGDEKKVGYYACVLSALAFDVSFPLLTAESWLSVESLFFLTQSMTVLQWSRASDYVGRKPILMIGLFGTATSVLCFGLSRTFWALVVSRCLCGLLNGNVGVMKSAMGDLTDRTNRAEGFAYLPIVWAIGASTIPGQNKPHILAEGEGDRTLQTDIPRRRSGPRPLRELLIFPVIISVSNYVALGFLDTSLRALLPLFLAMPIEIGGLGLSPPKIGLILSAYGLAIGLFQVLFFARMVHRFGEKRVFFNGIITCLPIFALFPIMSMIARHFGLSFIIWALVGCVLALGTLMDTSFAAIFMFVTASAPKSSRGSVNGMSQTLVALARAIGPAMSTSLFSLSVQHNLLGGYMVYLVFFVLSGFALILAGRLPDEIWDDVDE